MSRTLSVLVQNEAGVLSKVCNMFSGRGYNIESLTVAPTIDTDYSRITIVTTEDDNAVEQICKQLHRLINVLKVMDITDSNVDREIVLIKVNAKHDDRSEVLRISELFDAKIIDISSKVYTLEAMGDANKIKNLIEVLKPIGIKEFVRSGKVAIAKETQLVT